MSDSQAAPPQSIRTFRFLLIACGAINLALMGWSYIEYDFVPAEVAQAMALADTTSSFLASDAVWWVVVGGYSAACFAMYPLWKAARTIYAVMCLCVLVLALFSPLAVLTPVSNVMGLLWATSQGAILALAYSPPLAAAFR